jgi:hypothetical protein
MKRCSPWPTPFLPGSAEDRSSLFVWFIDSMARSDSSGAYVSAFRLCTFADRPRSLSSRGAPEVSGSRACCFSPCAGSKTTQDRLLARVYREAAVVPSSIRKESASWFCVFRSSIARPTDSWDRARAPTYRWRATSLALSVAGWVHNSTVVTFPEAPL